MSKALADNTTGVPGPRSIERLTLNDVAYEKLKRAIPSGCVEAHMTLVFRNLPSELGASMMPVREAVACPA